MRTPLRLLFCFWLLPLLAMAQVSAPVAQQRPMDSLQVSLLTCAPGHQIYRLYGHTALRFQKAERPKEDWTYNFGWFSFDTPNFVLKFVLGLTDYSMCQESTALFLSGQIADDMPVTEQVLNLTPNEARALQAELQRILTKPGSQRREFAVEGISGFDTLVMITPDWTYRYNFLYDNCTTRAVQAIIKVVEAQGERVVYPTLKGNEHMLTQREMIHEFTRQSPWFEFGQDLLLGPEVDQKHSVQEMTRLNFLPTYAQNFFAVAKIQDAQGRLRPLVNHTQPLFPLTPQPKRPALPFGPNLVLWSWLGLCVCLTFGEYRSRRAGAPTQRAWRIWTGTFDTITFVLMGLVGLLLTLMVGWSEHPAVGTNWLLCLFNPLLLLYMVSYWWHRRRGRRDVLAPWLAVGAIIYFTVKIVGVQVFPTATDALAWILLIRGLFLFLRPGFISASE